MPQQTNFMEVFFESEAGTSIAAHSRERNIPTNPGERKEHAQEKTVIASGHDRWNRRFVGAAN
jgi:hypothetical protein